MRDEEPWFKSLLNQFQIVNEKFSSYVVIYGLKFVPVLRKTVQHMKGYSKLTQRSIFILRIDFVSLYILFTFVTLSKKYEINKKTDEKNDESLKAFTIYTVYKF